MKLSDVVDVGTHSWEEVLKPGERLGGPSLWGNSKYQVFKFCPYLYYWLFIKRMARMTYDPNLEIGGLYHEARARYGQAFLDAFDVETGDLSVPQKVIDERCTEAGFDIINRAAKIVPGIAGTVRRLFESWLILSGPGMPRDRRRDLYGVEVVLEVNDPIPYSARLDEWYWDRDRRGARISEIKTAGEYDGRLVNSYRMDAQFLGHQYLWRRTMTRKVGPLVGYDVDLITKTTEVRSTLEHVPIDWALTKSFEEEISYLYSQIIRCQTTRIWPKRMSYYCTRPWSCQLYDHCASRGRITLGWRKKKKGEY